MNELILASIDKILKQQQVIIELLTDFKKQKEKEDKEDKS